MECGERVGEGWFFLGAEDEGPDATDVGDINDLFEGVGLFAAALHCCLSCHGIRD